MTKPIKLGFGNFKLWLEDAANPGTYIAPCGFNQRAMTITAATSETPDPDCDDPEAPTWLSRAVTSLSAEVTGAGVFALDGYSVWRNRMLAGLSFPIRVEFDDTGAHGGGYWAGSAILTTLGHSVQLGNDANKTQANVALSSDGEWTWSDAV